jgi:hypothetical protein
MQHENGRQWSMVYASAAAISLGEGNSLWCIRSWAETEKVLIPDIAVRLADPDSTPAVVARIERQNLARFVEAGALSIMDSHFLSGKSTENNFSIDNDRHEVN